MCVVTARTGQTHRQTWLKRLQRRIRTRGVLRKCRTLHGLSLCCVSFQLLCCSEVMRWD